MSKDDKAEIESEIRELVSQAHVLARKIQTSISTIKPNEIYNAQKLLECVTKAMALRQTLEYLRG